MRCMNSACGQEVSGANLKFYQGKLVLCPSCNELAEKASRDIEKAFHRARETADTWLLNHAMSGGLFRGGTGAPNIEVKIEEPA